MLSTRLPNLCPLAASLARMSRTVISSDKIRRELGFAPKFTVQDAVQGLCTAFSDGLVPDPLNGANYYNIRRMQQISLS